MRNEGAEEVLRFSSGGRGVGIVGLVGVAGFLLYGVLEPSADYAAWAWPAGLFAGVAIWAILVRPGVHVEGPDLELRNMLHSRWIPLERVTRVAVAQVTVVQVGDRRYVGSGVSRTRRQMARDDRRGPTAKPQDHSYGWIVEQRLTRFGERARELASGEERPVRRTWAWPEIVALLVLGLAAAVLALAA